MLSPGALLAQRHKGEIVPVSSISSVAVANALDVRVAPAEDLRVTTLGTGEPVVLIPGLFGSAFGYRKIMPLLAENHTVIVPDLRGAGDSSKPESGYDKKNMAVDIHDLTLSLGFKRASIVGHDIGLMVAYAYAAQFPQETERVVLMDAFLPGVDGWEAIYNNPTIWHFRFNGPTPEALVAGRERIYFEHFWNDFASNKTQSIPEADRVAYTAAYARPGRMRAAWAYFVSFQQAATDFAELSRSKLTMPVLAMGGEKANGDALGKQVKLVATKWG